MKKVVITGLGVVTSAGKNVEEFFESLTLPKFKNFTNKPRVKLNIDIAVYQAEPECFDTDNIDPEFEHPTGLICIKSARECLQDYARLGGKSKPDALVLGTSTGGQYKSEEFLFSALDPKTKTKEINFTKQGGIFASTRAVANDLNIEGKMLTVSTACTSSANAITMGASLIERGDHKCVIAGGGDALCSTTMAGFHILKLTGPNRCIPFGDNRPGLTLGDGTAFLMLEDKDEVIKQNRKYYAEILGYGMNSDAYHMTAPSENGEGIIKVIEDSLKKAGLTPQDIDFINAHGTGTQLNDKTEAYAISQIFGDRPVASIKGLVGHTLGGAGSVEAIASIYSILKRRAFENFGNNETGKDCSNVNLVPKGGLELKESPIIMSNSFAFGGNNCSIIFGGGVI
jgi:3-oxoacyl-(acyl-carrier-protein) synthase